MATDFSAQRIFLFALLVLLLSEGSTGGRKIIHEWKDQVEDDDDGFKGDQLRIKHGSDEKTQTHPSSHMDHMDLSRRIFFSMNDLKVGKTFPLYFSNKDPSSSPRLLSREEADSVPFFSTKLSYLLEFFSFSKDSPQAKAMEYTLTECELEPMEGEIKFCATSLESMLDLVRSTFGLDTQFKVLTSKQNPTVIFQNYTILEDPKDILAQTVIGCHTMPYPYVVYYCHVQAGGNKLFEVLVEGDNGERLQAVGVCHLHTSKWDRDSAAFRVLKIKPGSSPVCHVFPADNIVWATYA